MICLQTSVVKTVGGVGNVGLGQKLVVVCMPSSSHTQSTSVSQVNFVCNKAFFSFTHMWGNEKSRIKDISRSLHNLLSRSSALFHIYLSEKE